MIRIVLALLLFVGGTAHAGKRLPMVPPQQSQCREFADVCNRPNSPLVRVELPFPRGLCTEMNPHGDPKIKRFFFERPRCRGRIDEANWYGSHGAANECAFEERV